MSIKDTSKTDLHAMLLKDGNIKASTAPSAFKHIDVAASRAAAIAARRNELNCKVIVTKKPL